MAQNGFEFRISEPLIRGLLDHPRLKEKRIEIEHFQIANGLLIFRGAVGIDLMIKVLRVGFELHVRPLDARDRRISARIEKLDIAGALPLPVDVICKRFLHRPPKLTYAKQICEADLEAVLNRIRRHSFASEAAMVRDMMAHLRTWPAMAGVDLSADTNPDVLLGRVIDAILSRPEIKLTGISTRDGQIILNF